MNKENELLADAIIEDSVRANCGHMVECTEVCADCERCQECCTCRVAQTIDRLISNLPEAVIKLKAMGLTSLARQIQNDLDNLVYWDKRGGLVTKERSEMWRKQASMYKELHAKDTNRLGHLAAQNIKRAKFKPDGCTCVDEPGDEYYCSVHGGEGCWIDLKVKSDMLIETLGDWIVGQNNDVKRSAASAFGDELKTLGKTLSKVTDGNRDRDQCNCDQINWTRGPHHQTDCPMYEEVGNENQT